MGIERGLHEGTQIVNRASLQPRVPRSGTAIATDRSTSNVDTAATAKKANNTFSLGSSSPGEAGALRAGRRSVSLCSGLGYARKTISP
jgi:hypothetical protein